MNAREAKKLAELVKQAEEKVSLADLSDIYKKIEAAAAVGETQIDLGFYPNDAVKKELKQQGYKLVEGDPRYEVFTFLIDWSNPQVYCSGLTMENGAIELSHRR